MQKKESKLTFSVILILFITIYSVGVSKSDTIIFYHGHKLNIKEYLLKDNYITLKLSEGNEISIPVAWVKEIKIEPYKPNTKNNDDKKNTIPGEQYLNLIKQYSELASVDWKLIFSIIKYESNFKKDAVSPKGAMGLMQLMPDTAKSSNLKNPFDADENIKAGIKHFKELLDLYNNDVKLALAAYNAGKDTIKQYSGIPPFKETQNYVKNIISFYEKIKE